MHIGPSVHECTSSSVHWQHEPAVGHSVTNEHPTPLLHAVKKSPPHQSLILLQPRRCRRYIRQLGNTYLHQKRRKQDLCTRHQDSLARFRRLRQRAHMPRTACVRSSARPNRRDFDIVRSSNTPRTPENVQSARATSPCTRCGAVHSAQKRSLPYHSEQASRPHAKTNHIRQLSYASLKPLEASQLALKLEPRSVGPLHAALIPFHQ